MLQYRKYIACRCNRRMAATLRPPLSLDPSRTHCVARTNMGRSQPIRLAPRFKSSTKYSALNHELEREYLHKRIIEHPTASTHRSDRTRSRAPIALSHLQVALTQYPVGVVDPALG